MQMCLTKFLGQHRSLVFHRNPSASAHLRLIHVSAGARRTCLQERGVGVDGGDGAHALRHDGVADGVPGVGLPQRVPQHRIHVVRGALVTGAQACQNLQQLDLHQAIFASIRITAPLYHRLWASEALQSKLCQSAPEQAGEGDVCLPV